MAKDLRVTPLKGVTLETTTLSANGARTQSLRYTIRGLERAR